MEVKVSVVIPVYNAENYMDRCLQRLSLQTLEEIEIILVDDGSTDASLDRCYMHAVKDGRIKVIHQSNKGPAAARNTGLSYATGKWVAFVDPDDYVDKDYCKAAYDYGEECSADVVMFGAVRGNSQLVLADESICFKEPFEVLDIQCAILYPYMIKESRNELVRKRYESAKISDLALAAPWNKLYRMSFLKEHDLKFPENLLTLDDMTFNYLVFGCSPKVAYLNRELYHYCFNIKSITNKYDPDRIDKDVAVFQTIRDDIRQNASEEKEQANKEQVNKEKLFNDNKLMQAYYARVIKSFAILCRLCFFNPKSTNGFKDKLKLALDTMDMDEYKEAFKQIDIRMLEPKLKAVVFAVRTRNPFFLYVLHLLQTMALGRG